MAVKTKNEVAKIDDMGGNLVSMSNALTRAAHGLSLAEKRIVLSAVAKLDSRTPPMLDPCPLVRITAAEYAETFGLDMDTAYDQLKEGGKNLYNRSISFYEPAFKRGKEVLKLTQMRWVGQATYHDGEGWIELGFWHLVVPHLMGLKRQFTSYQLQQATRLRSVYTWKLLELLMRFSDTGWAEYTIEDFQASMDATESQIANFGKLRTQIIEPAIKELTTKDKWLIDYQPIKAGRRVKAIRFDFSRA